MFIQAKKERREKEERTKKMEGIRKGNEMRIDQESGH